LPTVFFTTTPQQLAPALQGGSFLLMQNNIFWTATLQQELVIQTEIMLGVVIQPEQPLKVEVHQDLMP
ncbi:MAG: hypothetical protein PHV25_03155, partial [Candidatus Pacebacteria bacterium]|nr:hypothetical protein [Candidatus Paceibacterota bacterium]